MSKNNIDVSIILVNYNTCLMTIDAVNSIIEKTSGISFEIIIVDNASKDNSFKIISEKFSKYNNIYVIKNENNEGFGKANNKAVSFSNGKYLLFLNTDTILINNAIKVMYDYISKNDFTGAVGGNLYSENLQPSYSFDMMPNIFVYILGIPIYWFKLNVLKKPCGFNFSGKPMKVGYIIGADLMVKKSIFLKCGMFDSDFFMYFEEIELEYRIKKYNKKIVSLPEAKIIHYGGGSFKDKQGNIIEDREVMINKSRFIMFEKTHGKIYARMFYIIIKSLYTLLSIINKNYQIRKQYIEKGYLEYLLFVKSKYKK